ESAEVVTATGEVLRAGATEHPDLFWALRRGGGNFGVVTRFEFRLHPVGPELLSGLIVYPFSEAQSVLQQYRESVSKAPDELCVRSVLAKAPPLPSPPAEIHGKQILELALLYVGDPQHGQPLIQPLCNFDAGVDEHVVGLPHAALAQAFDPPLTA